MLDRTTLFVILIWSVHTVHSVLIRRWGDWVHVRPVKVPLVQSPGLGTLTPLGYRPGKGQDTPVLRPNQQFFAPTSFCLSKTDSLYYLTHMCHSRGTIVKSCQFIELLTNPTDYNNVYRPYMPTLYRSLRISSTKSLSTEQCMTCRHLHQSPVNSVWHVAICISHLWTVYDMSPSASVTCEQCMTCRHLHQSPVNSVWHVAICTSHLWTVYDMSPSAPVTCEQCMTCRHLHQSPVKSVWHVAICTSHLLLTDRIRSTLGPPPPGLMK